MPAVSIMATVYPLMSKWVLIESVLVPAKV